MFASDLYKQINIESRISFLKLASYQGTSSTEQVKHPGLNLLHPVFEHHVATYGHPSQFGYHDFASEFTAEHFDPEEWADLFQQTGANDQAGRASRDRDRTSSATEMIHCRVPHLPLIRR